MKKAFLALVAFAFSMMATAGTPTAVKDASGVKVYGTELVIKAEKDSTSGNRVKITYIGSNYQHVVDSGTWQAYAKIVGGFDKPVTGYHNGVEITFDIAKVGRIECLGTQSAISWPTNSNTDYLSDNCAFVLAAQQVAQ